MNAGHPPLYGYFEAGQKTNPQLAWAANRDQGPLLTAQCPPGVKRRKTHAEHKKSDLASESRHLPPRSEEQGREDTSVIFRLPWPAATAMLGPIATVIPE
jgi:hypothetical protein